jgi:tRNA U55 pseudouridine synthase TruB
MRELTRTAIGPFLLEDAVPIAELTRERLCECICSPLVALPEMPRSILSDPQVDDVHHGRPVCVEGGGGDWGECVGVDSAGQLLAILSLRPDGRYWPVSVFPPVSAE